MLIYPLIPRLVAMRDPTIVVAVAVLANINPNSILMGN